MTEIKLKLLLVDDEDSVREPLKRFLQANPYCYDVVDVSNFEEAVKMLNERKGYFDVALIDEVLEDGLSGLDILKHIKSSDSDVEVILFTGWGLKSGEEVRKIGAYSYIAKPFDADQLAITIYNAAERQWIRREHKYMEALVRASQALAKTTQLDKQLSLSWEFVSEQLDVSSFYIGLYSSSENKISFPLVFDEGRQTNLPDVILSENPNLWGLAGYVIKNGEEVLWSSLEEKEKVCVDRKIFPRVDGMPSSSCFCVPFVIGEQVRGVLSAQSYQPYVITPPLQNALRALTGHLSIALENSRLFEELNQKIKDNETQSQRISALEKLAININSNLELETILTETCQVAVEFFRADHSGLLIFDKDLVRGKVEAEYPDFGVRGQYIPLRGIPIEERLIETLAPVIVNDVLEEEGLGSVKNIMIELGIQSSLLVPVIGKMGLLGSFSLDSTQQKKFFSEGDIELCKIFASQVAIAIENARLYHEAKVAQKKIRASFEASNALVLSQPTAQLLEDIIYRTRLAVDASWVSVVLINELGVVRNLYTTGLNKKNDIEKIIRPDGITMHVMRTGSYRKIEDTELGRKNVNPIMFENKVAAALCLPFSIQGKRIGVVWIHYNTPREFPDYEVEAIQLFVNQAAVAYDNARYIRELVQLRKATESMTSVDEPKQVLQKIVEGAMQVLDSDAALIWSYDPIRDIFIPEELVAEGILEAQLEKFRKEEPKAGRTTRYVLEKGYLKVEDVSTSEEIGNPTKDLLGDLRIKSFQSIRLSVAGETLGVLHVDYKIVKKFSKEERKILEHFANHAALTLKKARLFEQVKRTRAATRVIARAGTFGNLNKTLDAVVTGAKDVLGCDVATLYTYSEESGRFIDYRGVGQHKPENMRPPSDILETSSLWRILHLHEKTYHLSDDALNDDLLKGGFVENERIKSALGIQLRFDTRRVGVMFINYRNPHRFNDDEVEDALHFANQAAVAIRNAGLLDDLRRRNNQLQAISDISKSISTILDLEKLINQSVNVIQGRLRLYYVGLFIVDEKHEHAVLRGGTGEAGEIMLANGHKLKVDDTSMVGWCIANIKARIALNVNEETIRFKNPQLPDTRSEMALPLVTHNKCIGALTVQSDEKDAFTTDDIAVLQTMADQLTIAIENALQYEELIKTKGVLAARTALAWTGMASSVWRHAIEKHAITIREQIELMRDDLSPFSIGDVVDERLEMIERLANQILKKPLTAPLGSEEDIASISINEFIQERTGQLWTRKPYSSVDLEVVLELEDLASIRVDSEWLRQALDIVFDNAVEATEGLLERKIIVSTVQIDGKAAITIQDNGYGIPSEIKEQLFRKPINKSKDARGLGMGLIFAQMIVNTFGGEIRVKNTGPTGTTILFLFPLEN